MACYSGVARPRTGLGIYALNPSAGDILEVLVSCPECGDPEAFFCANEHGEHELICPSCIDLIPTPCEEDE